HHLRGPIRARPHHAAIGADVAGLHAMGDLRPVGGAAEVRHRNGADRAGAGGGKKTPPGKSAGRGAGNPDRHASLLGVRRQNVPKALTDLERFDDGSITEVIAQAEPAARNCAPTRCRLCGGLINSALRSATALWNCSIAILKAVKV